MELIRAVQLAREAFANLEAEIDLSIDIEIVDSTNLLELLDSMDVVGLIMETEALIEAETQRYVPLANDKSFDADGSPLRSFGSWVAYILDRVAEENGS
jgi:hypothetical protein